MKTFWFLISDVSIARLAYKSVVEFTRWNLLAHGASVLGLEIIGCYSTSECWSSLSIQRRYILEVRLSTRKTDSSNFSSGFSTSLHARLDLCETATDPNWLPFSVLWAPSSDFGGTLLENLDPKHYKIGLLRTTIIFVITGHCSLK